MIIFLYGQDTYRSRQKLQEIIEHYQKVHKSGLNLKFLEGLKLDYQDFKDEFQQASMFQEKKLFVFQNIFQNQEFKNSFLENGKKFVNSNDIIIFYQDGEVPPKDLLFEFLAKNAKTQDSPLLTGQKLKNWTKKEFEKYQAEIEPMALEILINYTGNDLWRLSNEIRKLSAFAKKREIKVKDVGLLVRPRIETDIFKTIDAIASKNKKQALSLLHKHLEKGDSPLYLLAMINFQLRNLLLVKESKNPGLHPYVIKKSLWQAQKFTNEELKKIYHRLFEVDFNIKTGKVEPQTAIDCFIAEI